MNGRPRKPVKTPKAPKSIDPATAAVHAGPGADAATGALTPPLYWTSTYKRKGLDDDSPWTYGRTVNPTRQALEQAMAQLEGGAGACAYASGMSAAAAILHLLKAGDHVVASADIYGGTWRLFEGPLKRFGLNFSWVDLSDAKALRDALTTDTRLVWVETPSNPTLRLTDIRAVAKRLRGRETRLVVDNTFMSPLGQQPLAAGADLVLHSTTKYLNGHSDGVGGCVVAARPADVDALAAIQKTVGAILSPTDSYLVLRGIKTLALRMERHQQNAFEIARWLERQPAVARVHYPGLASHPQRALARRQMRGFGGVVSFELSSKAQARRFFSRLRLFVLAESLGGVESLANHPATMTHASMTASQRKDVGVTDELCRLSVGVEAVGDLIADLDHAFTGSRPATRGSRGRRR
jgi:cystathionine beta-lyase/cystathionine gamma-synthase